MKHYFRLTLLAFLITLFHQSINVELLGSYAPDCVLLSLPLFVLSRRKMKDSAINLAYFFAFTLGLFNSFLSNLPLGSLSLLYVFIVYCFSFLFRRTSHMFGASIIPVFMVETMYLVALSYLSLREINLYPILIQVCITILLYVILYTVKISRNSHINYDK